jgi:uncharacterized iron-regulated membrane protein
MQHAHHPGRWVAALALAALSVSACTKTGGEEEESNRGATLDSVPGSDVGAVTLTDVAEQRIDLKTAAIEQAADGMQIPYAALLYDPEGKTWTFVKINDHTFQRQPVTVDHITGDTAFLTEGPKAGSEVVVIGAAELYGVEEGVGDVE